MDVVHAVLVLKGFLKPLSARTTQSYPISSPEGHSETCRVLLKRPRRTRAELKVTDLR